MLDRAGRPLSTYVRLRRHALPEVALLDDGSAFAMFEVGGAAVQTLDVDVLYRLRARLNHSLIGLASNKGLVLYSWLCRGFAPPSLYPEYAFQAAFSAKLDAKYKARLYPNYLWLNRCYIGLLLRPGRLAGEWIGEQVERRREPKEAIDETPEARIFRLQGICEIAEKNLEDYAPRRLGWEPRGERVYNEMAEALAFAMAGRWRPIQVEAGATFGSLLSERLIFRRETIEIRAPGASAFAACFGFKKCPHQCPPGTTDALLTANFRFTLAQSFRFIPQSAALSKMSHKQHLMLTGGDRAVSQAKLLPVAADEVASGRMVMGDHGMVLTVFTHEPRALPRIATEAWDLIQNTTAQTAREDDALEAAYASMLPGNTHRRPRPALISSWNYASLAPMHGFPTGEPRSAWGPPLALLRTTGGTPYGLHLPTNTMVIGSTGSGKTVWLGMIISQSERLGAHVVLWDKDCGLMILVLAIGGRYLTIGSPTWLAPLKALTDSPEDIAHLASLVRGIVAGENGYVLTPEENRRLYIGLRGIMALPPRDRWMADLKAFLGVSRTGAAARLEPWCWGNEYGWVIDCPEDRVRLDRRVIGFDVTKWIDNKTVCGPVMLDLLHRTGKLADGTRRVIYQIDEGWKVIDIPAFESDAKNHMKTDRKKNAKFIFGTQSLSDPLKSQMADTFREQTQMVVSFAIERPNRDELRSFRFTERECDIIEELRPASGVHLIRHGRQSVVAHLALDGMGDEMAVVSGTTENVELMNRVRATVGDDDPERLIEAFHEARREREARTAAALARAGREMAL